MIQPSDSEYPPEVTVVIPSYWSDATIESCVGAAVGQRSVRRFEVRVIHGGAQPLPDGIDRRFPAVTFDRDPGDSWPAAKRNAGIRQARSPWVLFLDSDCVPGPTWLDTLVDAALDSAAVAVGGSVDIGEPFDDMAWVMHLLEFGEWLPGRNRRRWCRDIPTCNALYRKEALLAVGGFPEDLFPCEDTVANSNLRRRGDRILLVPEAVVAHHHTGTEERYLAKNRQFGAMYSLAAARYDLPGRHLRRRPLRGVISAGRALTMAKRAIRHRPPREWRLLVTMTPFTCRCLAAWSDSFTRPGTSRFQIARDTVAGYPFADPRPASVPTDG